MVKEVHLPWFTLDGLEIPERQDILKRGMERTYMERNTREREEESYTVIADLPDTMHPSPPAIA